LDGSASEAADTGCLVTLVGGGEREAEDEKEGAMASIISISDSSYEDEDFDSGRWLRTSERGFAGGAGETAGEGANWSRVSFFLKKT